MAHARRRVSSTTYADDIRRRCLDRRCIEAATADKRSSSAHGVAEKAQKVAAKHGLDLVLTQAAATKLVGKPREGRAGTELSLAAEAVKVTAERRAAESADIYHVHDVTGEGRYSAALIPAGNEGRAEVRTRYTAAFGKRTKHIVRQIAMVGAQRAAV